MKDNVIYVAAYCRVSTEKEDQVHSFEGQKRFFYTYIENHPEWQLYEIYADEGVSGTNVKKRVAFKRMMRDAGEGKFELILTKEISRFARNILDSISYTRELKRLGVGVLFMNDNLDTREGDAELRLAILSSIAQEESRRTSERVKWGQKRRMEAGVVFGHSLLGYDVREGRLFINETGALVVRRIFDAYTKEKMGISSIARLLSSLGYEPPKSKIWNASVILRILKNEKYCGDLVQKKTVTTDYLSHEKKYNHGEESMVVIRDHHEPIISRAQFELAQSLLSERKGTKVSVTYSRKYPFSGKIRCGICGKNMIARVQERKEGIYHLWRCVGGHASLSIRNDAVVGMMQTVMRMHDAMISDAKESVTAMLARYFFDGKGECENAMEKLWELYFSDEITKEEFLSMKTVIFDKKTQFENITDAFDDIFDDILFFRELLDFVTVREEMAMLRLKNDDRVFIFDRLKKGRRKEMIFRGIQNGELFLTENDESHHG